jgi:uncharacterized OB-fold protein
MTDQKPRRISYHAVLPFRYSAGRAASRFFAELRDHKRIMATRCSKCGKAYVPPRPVCGECFMPLEEWVEVGPGGTLVGFTVVYFPFLDPLTGKERPVPYGYGFILLDGVSTKIQHFIQETDISKLRFGLRVEPVFEEVRKGTFADIKYFRIVE